MDEHVPYLRTLAKHMARRCHASTVVDADDFFDVAYVAFVRALDRFEPDGHHGCSARTFALHRAKGAILDEMRRLDWIRDRAGHAGHARMLSWHEALTGADLERGFICRREETEALIDEHEARDLWDMVEWLLGPLRGRERLIARRYFVEGATQREIGAELGVTDTRICQLLTERIRPVVEGRAAIYRAA